MGKKAGQNPNLVIEKVVSAEDLFTDREEPRKAFWEKYYALGSGEFDVISFYGEGGIGKSTLLKKLGSEIEEKVKKGKLDYVYFSFESEPSKEEFLYSLSRKMMLRLKGLSFPLLDAAFGKIAEEGNYSLLAFEEKGRNILETEGAELVSSAVAEFLPYVGTFKKAASSIVKLSGRLKADWEKEKGPKKVLYNNITVNDGKYAIEKLHEYFRSDAYDYFENRETPFIIMLDGYEHFVNRVKDGGKSNLTDSWLYRADVGILDIPNIMWVIAGRNSLDWPEDLLCKEDCHRIGNLSDKDTTLFFRKAGIEDPQLVMGLYQLTHGTPAFLDLCVDTYHKVSLRKKPEIDDFGNNTEKLARRYLENMDSHKQAVLKMLSCFPNVWETKMAMDVAERLGYGNIKIVLDDLLPLSIFEKYPEGNRLHETVRDVLKKNTEHVDEIENEILAFAKENLLNITPLEGKNYLTLFSLYLEKDKRNQVSSEEMYKIVGILSDRTRHVGDYSFCQEVIKEIVLYSEKHGHKPETIVSAKNCMIYNFFRLGLYQEILKYGTENYEYAFQHLGESHPDTLSTLHHLGIAYSSLGQYEKALEIRTKCYEQRKEVLGETHPDTLRSLNGLGIAYSSLGQYEKALEIRSKCYGFNMEVMGENHPDTLSSLHNLGNAYSLLGQYEKALEIRMKCYERRKEVLGETHPDTRSSLNSLGNTYNSLGQYEKALEALSKCYEQRKEVLGEKHPDTLGSLHNLGNIYSDKGDYEKELEIRIKCYGLYKEVLGEKHPDTISSLNGLGNAYYLLGQYEKALEVFSKCYEQYKEVLGESHPDTISSHDDLIKCVSKRKE